jgi:uncharacterized protein
LNTTPKWVLDTNVVLDWLLFQDVNARFLDELILGRGVVLLASAVTIDELVAVLAYPKLALKAERQAQIATRYRQSVETLLLADRAAGPKLPRCRDPDDQSFVELAVAGRADMLVTRDKALLKLASRLKKYGVDVMTLAAAQSAQQKRRSCPVS